MPKYDNNQLIEWEKFKAFVDDRSLSIQYVETSEVYDLSAFDGPRYYESRILKNNAYDASDLADFETNYKPSGNLKLGNPYYDGLGLLTRTDIKGDSDGTIIGNVGDRLKVDALSTISIFPEYNPIPSKNIYYVSKYLLNGASKSLSVDGSSTPVIFSYAPSSGKTYIESLTIYLEDGGNPQSTGFGKLAALTNGVEVKFKVQGTSYLYSKMKDNIDLLMTFGLDTTTTGNSQGFVGNKYLIGRINFDPSITLDASTSDNITITINDNLSSLTTFRASAIYWEAL